MIILVPQTRVCMRSADLAVVENRMEWFDLVASCAGWRAKCLPYCLNVTFKHAADFDAVSQKALVCIVLTFVFIKKQWAWLLAVLFNPRTSKVVRIRIFLSNIF